MAALLPASSLTYLRSMVGEGLPDTCKRLVYSAAGGDYGYGTPSYTAGVSMACLFSPRTMPDANETGAVLMVDADLYLDSTAVLLPDDRVIITHLLGVAVAAPQMFEIVSGPVRGHTSQHASLRLTTS